MVEALRDALLERQELIGDDILAVIRESQPSPGSQRAPRTRSPGQVPGPRSCECPTSVRPHPDMQN